MRRVYRDLASPQGVPLACGFVLAGALSLTGGDCIVADPLGGAHRVDAQGTPKRLFEAPRSLQAQPSCDPFGNLHVPCTDGHVYVLAPRPPAA